MADPLQLMAWLALLVVLLLLFGAADWWLTRKDRRGMRRGISEQRQRHGGQR